VRSCNRLFALAVCLHSGFTEIKDVTSAQYSIPYSIALQLVIGSQDLGHYLDEALWTDRRILDVIKKVRFLPLASAVVDLRHSCAMTDHLKDGTSLDLSVEHPKGSFLNPITTEEALAKFLHLATTVIGQGGAEEIRHAVENIEDMADIGELMELLCEATG